MNKSIPPPASWPQLFCRFSAPHRRSRLTLPLPSRLPRQQNPSTRRPPSPRAQAWSAPKDKTSYALGMNLAENLKAQSVDIDPNMLLKGMKDVLSGGKTLLTNGQSATLLELQSGLRKAQMEKMAKAGEKNKKEGEAFLAANKSKPGIVTLPSGLQYKVLHAGTGPKPTAADSVSCNYRGTLIDGTEFDSSL